MAFSKGVGVYTNSISFFYFDFFSETLDTADELRFELLPLLSEPLSSPEPFSLSLLSLSSLLSLLSEPLPLASEFFSEPLPEFY